MRIKFICASELSGEQIKAGMNDGTLIPWIDAAGLQRRDGEGRAWFRIESKTIRAVPPGVPMADDNDDIEATDVDVDDIDDDDNGLAEYREFVERERELALRQYSQIVLARARGHDIPDDVGFQILASANKTLLEFNADVEQLINLEREIRSYD